MFSKQYFSDSSPRLATEKKPPREGQNMPENTSVFKLLVFSALADLDHPLTPLRKTPFRKLRSSAAEKRGLWEGVVQEPLRRALFCVFLCSEVILSCKSHRNFFPEIAPPMQAFSGRPPREKPQNAAAEFITCDRPRWAGSHRPQSKTIKYTKSSSKSRFPGVWTK